MSLDAGERSSDTGLDRDVPWWFCERHFIAKGRMTFCATDQATLGATPIVLPLSRSEATRKFSGSCKVTSSYAAGRHRFYSSDNKNIYTNVHIAAVVTSR